MKFEYLFQKSAIFFLSLAFFAAVAPAQKPGSPVPRQEKLLNGLKILIWNTPAADKVTVKVRVHSGSAFDPQDREGVMKLLSESIFPNQATREFFTDDLGGSLEIISNYDYIQINATSHSGKFLTMLETLATAISNPYIDKETTAILKISLIAKLTDLEKDPAYVADRAVAKRLFGTFPYGRPQMGTPESIQKIDFADLRFAKDRLFTADNATVAITGNIDGNLAFRAVRRYFGSWLKSDKKIPSTFAMPQEPETIPLGISLRGSSNSEGRFALRGLARNDNDYAASEILGRILEARFKIIMPSRQGESFSVANNAHILPGAVVFRYGSSAKLTNNIPMNLFLTITNEEFARAKANALMEYDKRPIEDLWLDADTYKFVLEDDKRAFQNAAITDVQRVSGILAKNPVVTVAVTGN